MKINLTDKYTTKQNVPVTILCTNLRGDHPVAAIIHQGDKDYLMQYTSEGTNIYSPYNQLIRVSPYVEWKIDDKVLCSNMVSGLNGLYKRYFAGINTAGEPLAFGEGSTSWSSDGNEVVSWPYMRRVEDE